MLKDLIKDFYSFAKDRLGFDKDCKVILKKDCENAKDPAGFTGHYNPQDLTITIFISGRHNTDILRSISHELFHHYQNCNGQINNISTEQGYAQQKDGRELEREAYEKGNLLFRDWQDKMRQNNNKKGLNEMFTRRNSELFTKYMKKMNKIILKEEKLEGEELKKAIKIEKEHEDTIVWLRNHPDATNEEIEERIVNDHTSEFDDYYEELPKMEKKLEKEQEKEDK